MVGGLDLASLCEEYHPLKFMMPLVASLHRNLGFTLSCNHLRWCPRRLPAAQHIPPQAVTTVAGRVAFYLARYLLSSVSPSLKTLTSQLLEISESKQDFTAL